MEAYIEDQVLSTAPRMNLDELYDSKDTICGQIKKELSPKMEQYGFTIEKTLVTDIDPDPEVKATINKINATARLAVAAKNEAEAKLVATVMEAEGEKVLRSNASPFWTGTRFPLKTSVSASRSPHVKQST